VNQSTESDSVARYVFIYVGWLIAASVVVAIVSILLPVVMRSSGLFLVVSVRVAAAMAAYQAFIKRHARLLDPEEYWDLVAFCGVLAFAWEAFWFCIGAALDDRPIHSWQAIVFGFVGGALLDLAAPAFGFSNRMGNRILQTQLKRLSAAGAIADAPPQRGR
jgi:hypothetical protein